MYAMMSGKKRSDSFKRKGPTLRLHPLLLSLRRPTLLLLLLDPGGRSCSSPASGLARSETVRGCGALLPDEISSLASKDPHYQEVRERERVCVGREKAEKERQGEQEGTTGRASAVALVACLVIRLSFPSPAFALSLAPHKRPPDHDTVCAQPDAHCRRTPSVSATDCASQPLSLVVRRRLLCRRRCSSSPPSSSVRTVLVCLSPGLSSLSFSSRRWRPAHCRRCSLFN